MRQREPRELDPEYKGWIAKLPCPACFALGRYNRQVQVAHLRAGSLEHGKRHTGKAEKPHDRWTLPLCMPHHQGDKRAARVTQHAMSEEAFWEHFGINPFELCLALNEAFKAGHPGAPVIARFIAAGKREIHG